MIAPAASFRCCRFPGHVREALVATQSSPTKVHTTRWHRAGASPATGSPVSGGASAGEAYRLSRIQAEGWNAAHGISASILDRLDSTQIESLNPYAADPERTRWSVGFKGALMS